MAQTTPPEELFDFPCDYQFKAFGEACFKESFCREVLEAVRVVVPVDDAALQLRASSGGSYVCVTVTARVNNRTQIEKVYAGLRELEGLRYLL